MHQDGHQPFGQNSVLIANIDPRKVYATRHLLNGRVIFPNQWNELPDVRLPDHAAANAALAGIPPQGSGLDRFDPVLGPFTLPAAAMSGWAQSLDFLRDISGPKTGPLSLSCVWLATWANTEQNTPSPMDDFLNMGQAHYTKTDRLIWRAKRVINLLSYGLPLLNQLDPPIVSKICAHLLTDIAKLAAPTETLLASLTSGFHPLSPRALWLRALALTAVETVFPAMLVREVTDRAIEQVINSFQKDGTMEGASIMATLSASADMCAIGHVPLIAPVLEKARQALATLRHDRGTLVMFGAGSGEYAGLLERVLGDVKRQPSPVLNNIGIVRVDCGPTNVWLRAPEIGQSWAGLCDVEIAGAPILTNWGQLRSGVMFNAPIQRATGRCKRRDQHDAQILESQSDIQVAGETVSYCRYIKVSKAGNHIIGEDILSFKDVMSLHIVRQICFAFPKNCHTRLIGSGRGVEIVTQSASRWRLLVSNTNLEIEASLQSETEDEGNAPHCGVVFRPIERALVKQLKMTWELIIEDQT